MQVLSYTRKALARRSEKQFPYCLGAFLLRGFVRDKTMQNLCACGCGQETPIATRTRTGRGQEKGKPLRFINGHNSRLLTSEEQKRRVLFRDYSLSRYSGSPENYIKYHQKHLHRVVAERMLNRPLEPGEIVHHKDGNKWNNEESNLEVMTQSEHARIHNLERWKKVKEDRADDL